MQFGACNSLLFYPDMATLHVSIRTKCVDFIWLGAPDMAVALTEQYNTVHSLDDNWLKKSKCQLKNGIWFVHLAKKIGQTGTTGRFLEIIFISMSLNY